MEYSQVNLLMLNSKIFRYSQSYLDKVLKKYELSNGSFRYLFILEREEGICQNEISQKIGNDKAMSTRIIMKLMKSGYLKREQNTNDSRAYRLFLTEKAKEVLPKVREETNKLMELMTANLTKEEEEQMMHSMYKVFLNTRKLNG